MEEKWRTESNGGHLEDNSPQIRDKWRTFAKNNQIRGHWRTLSSMEDMMVTLKIINHDTHF